MTSWYQQFIMHIFKLYYNQKSKKENGLREVRTPYCAQTTKYLWGVYMHFNTVGSKTADAVGHTDLFCGLASTQ